MIGRGRRGAHTHAARPVGPCRRSGRGAARIFAQALALALALTPLAAAAHGLLLSLASRERQLVGTAYYTNGAMAANEWVEVLDLTSGAPAHGLRTDSTGRFASEAVAGHRYRVTAYGEEGHETALEIVAGGGRARLLERATSSSAWPPPAWAVIGALLLASLVPAWLTRRR